MPQDDRHARLDAARWLAALAVVLLHSAAQPVSDAAYGSGAWIAANFYDSAVRWCVPVFVMISGALLLAPDRDPDVQRFYTRRVARICVPLLFWTLFYLGWRAMQEWWDLGRADLSYWPRKIAEGAPYYHLWYLYMIVGLYLLAPLVRILYLRSSATGRKAWVAGILGAGVLDVLYRQALGGHQGFFLTWCLPYLGYFVAGRMIFDGEWRLPRPGWLAGIAVAATAAGVHALSDDGAPNFYFYDYFSLTVPLMSLAVFQWIVDSPRLPALSWLAPLTFGIYLVHPVFLDLARHSGLDRADGLAEAWRLPALATAIFGLSALTSWLLRRHRLTRRLV